LSSVSVLALWRNGSHYPLPAPAVPPTIATMTATLSTQQGLPRNPDSLGGLARRLAEVARAIRDEAQRSGEADELGRVFADVEAALGDLALAAEHTADAVIAADRPPGTRATQVSPTPAARAVSWRLHGLAGALRTSHRVCSAVQQSASPGGPSRTRHA
jgi:hypothetical protein